MEKQTPFGKPDYELPDYREKVQSQLPALHLLMQLGWQYLTPEETVNLRGGRLGSTILEPILVDHIRSHCCYEFKGATHPFTENAIQNAVQALKSFRATGATHQNEQAYDLLCLGTSVPQTVEGDTKSFTIDFIDWKNPDNNSYHCTAEYKVERIGFQKHYIPDIVLFVNGIPLVVIECKRSAYTRTKKKPIDLAIDQLDDYQAKDGIPQLFLYSQLLLALARRYFGCVSEALAEYGEAKDKPGTNIALQVTERIAPYKIRDWRNNQDKINKMRGEIDDILFEVAEQHSLDFSLDDHDAIIGRCIEVAIANED